MSQPTLAPRSHAPSARGPSNGDGMVVLQGLTKVFPKRRTWAEILRTPFKRDEVEVVRDVSLSVQEGEFFGLLGPNGAGKSTLFKMLATLIIPDAGTATVGGFSVTDESEEVRRMLTPVIPDERSLYWRLSALENVRLFASLHGLRGSEAESRALGVLESVGLADTEEKMVGQFSSGMKQRLLIARALLARPRVLLLDEPTRSLDPLSARDFRRFLRDELATKQGVTVLLATHNAEEALELCDRLAVLDRGRLLAAGTVDELRNRVGDDEFELHVQGDVSPSALEGVAGAHEVRDVSEEGDGWRRFRLRLGGGESAAADLVSHLVTDGLRVSRIEHMTLTLADLLERIVEEGRPPGA